MSKSRGSILWPGAIFALLAMNAGIVALTVVLALSDRPLASQALYGALAGDSDAQRRMNASLGWKAAMSVDDARSFRISLVDSSGRPIRAAQVHADVFRENNPDSRTTIAFIPDGSGIFTAACPGGRDGRWRVQIHVEALASVFTAEESLDIPRDPSTTREP